MFRAGFEKSIRRFSDRVGGGGGLQPPALGQPWLGGYYMGTTIHEGKDVGIVVAPKALGESSRAWKTSNTATAGTDDADNGVTDLFAADAAGLAAHPGFSYVRGLQIGLYFDWYIPARNELLMIYANRASLSGDEAYSAARYWSGTQSGNFGVGKDFSTGSNVSGNKDSLYLVRAVRRVPLS